MVPSPCLLFMEYILAFQEHKCQNKYNRFTVFQHILLQFHGFREETSKKEKKKRKKSGLHSSTFEVPSLPRGCEGPPTCKTQEPHKNIYNPSTHAFRENRSNEHKEERNAHNKDMTRLKMERFVVLFTSNSCSRHYEHNPRIHSTLHSINHFETWTQCCCIKANDVYRLNQKGLLMEHSRQCLAQHKNKSMQRQHKLKLCCSSASERNVTVL